ncbi:MAG: orotidine-5'-phosphate decarboxylase [bacterium]|nr:orotidine-5'-phosphate decarboxylase [bacterium]
MISESNRIIAALDMSSMSAAIQFAKALREHIAMVKVGFLLFMCGGPPVMRYLAGEMRFPTFLDLKFPGIPSEVREASADATRLGVAMFTVYTLNSLEALRAAREGVDAAMAEPAMAGRSRPKVLGTTVLTSQDYESLRRLGLVGRWVAAPGEPGQERQRQERQIQECIVSLAQLVQEAGLDGVVTSAAADEVIAVRNACGPNFTIVATSVNVAGMPVYDQKRAGRAGEAVAAGADYVVIGRALLQAKDPVAKVKNFAEEIAAAEAEREAAS